MSIANAEKKMKNLVLHYGFCSGKSFYEAMPQLIYEFYGNKNLKKHGKKLVELLLNYFITINDDRIKFEVDEHLDAGFNVLKKILENKNKEEKSDFIEKIIPSLLVDLILLFLEENNPHQISLFVIGINNIKHLPLKFIEFMKYLM